MTSQTDVTGLLKVDNIVYAFSIALERGKFRVPCNL